MHATDDQARVTYRHTQIGWSLILILAVVLLLVGAFTASASQVPRFALSLHVLIALAAIAMFGTLTIEMDPQELRWRFGIGLIRKHASIADIASSEIVRNKWWYGLGIRLIPAGYWLYNVSGLDAVEVTLKSGKRFRLGTDEPAQLHEAIQAALGARNNLNL